ncbi:hypothetical protein CCZ37_17635 [Vibrio qinghaiensis]|uniref:Uncharacterized protein n=1 Tax=Vibrio qinghaiensis TaxID=2025808 RepID=A0A223N3D1_9VIBR|nr:hypothetical protein [Vibrio qinghaiensis]ASU24269.1 hypothetical protein CCZ37_17635 [Vibrio qinghaiensis]
MHWHFIKYVWFTFLAVVLPSQAFGYLIESETHRDAEPKVSLQRDAEKMPLTAIVDQQTLPQAIAIQQPISDQQSISVQQDKQTAPPVSKSLHSDTSAAIVTASRWGVTSRVVEYDGPTFVDNTPNYDVTVAPFRLYLFPVAELVAWQARPYSSHHRISGWKETNAMYVALNSQY